MASTTPQLIALAMDLNFRLRVRNIALQEAAVVYAEAGGTPNHAARKAFALKLLNTPGVADQLADVLVSRTNLVAGTTTYDFANRAVLTDVTDAAILSQLATDWDMLSGA